MRRTLPDENKQQFAELLERSFDTGMKQIDETAARHAGDLGTAKELAGYLRNFRYRLGPDEWHGLDEFRRLIRQRDLLEPI